MPRRKITPDDRLSEHEMHILTERMGSIFADQSMYLIGMIRDLETRLNAAGFKIVEMED